MGLSLLSAYSMVDRSADEDDVRRETGILQINHPCLPRIDRTVFIGNKDGVHLAGEK